MLTKRPERARAELDRFFGPLRDEATERIRDAATQATGDRGPVDRCFEMLASRWPNVWLGTSIESSDYLRHI